MHHIISLPDNSMDRLICYITLTLLRHRVAPCPNSTVLTQNHSITSAHAYASYAIDIFQLSLCFFRILFSNLTFTYNYEFGCRKSFQSHRSPCV